MSHRDMEDDDYWEQHDDHAPVPKGETETVICSACNGSGEGMSERSRCAVCGGSGEVEVEIEEEDDEDA